MDALVGEPLRRRFYLLLLGFVAAWVIFTDLGEASLAWDEGIYACVVDQIRGSGDWIRLGVYSEPYFNKPPLYFWLTALIADWIPDGEAALRAWSALFGWCAVLATAWLGSRWFRPETGLLAGAILLSDGNFLLKHGAREGCFDTALTLLGLLAIIAYSGPARQRRLGWVLIGLAVGVSCLFKPAVGLPLLALLAGHFLLVERGLSWTSRLGLPVLALVVCVLLSLPWYLLQYCLFGKHYLWQVVVHQLFKRVTTGVVDIHLNGPLFYFEALPHSSLLFGLIWPALAYCIWLAWRRPRSWPAGLLAWLILAWVGLYSVSTEKVLRYVYPVYPLIALIIAQFAEAVLTAAWRGLARIGARSLERVNPVSWATLCGGLGALMLAIQVGGQIHAKPRVYVPWQTYCEALPALERGDLQFIVHRYRRNMPAERYYGTHMPRLVILDDPELLHDQLCRRPAVVLVNDPDLVPTLGLHRVVMNGRPTVSISKCYLVWTWPAHDRPAVASAD